MNSRPRILVAPLDWGLGHASRSVPVINECLAQEAEVIVASNGRALALLRATFPGLVALELPPYSIRYPSRNMYWNMLVQSRHLLNAARREHRQLQHLIHHHRIDAVISDNRFGCFSKKRPSVFISHQANLPLPPVFRQVAGKVLNAVIRQYDQCWIPDIEGPQGLSGTLSTTSPGLKVKYLGILSQLSKSEQPALWPQNEVVALLSGPEPQRTYLEEKVLLQLKACGMKALIIQGKTEHKERLVPEGHIKTISYLTQHELSAHLQAARYIICRSGYSSLMDLAVLGKKALFVPTPGQPEQEYLARRMQKLKYSPFQAQSRLDIPAGLAMMPDYHGMPTGLQQPALLREAVRGLLAAL
jgi:uncharacterized protein (TIGR00661 family)